MHMWVIGCYEVILKITSHPTMKLWNVHGKQVAWQNPMKFDLKLKRKRFSMPFGWGFSSRFLPAGPKRMNGCVVLPRYHYKILNINMFSCVYTRTTNKKDGRARFHWNVIKSMAVVILRVKSWTFPQIKQLHNLIAFLCVSIYQILSQCVFNVHSVILSLFVTHFPLYRQFYYEFSRSFLLKHEYWHRRYEWIHSTCNCAS